MVFDNKETILFDLDGTLTDPQIGITTCVSYALKKILNIDANPEELTDFIGPPLKEAFMDKYGMTEDLALKAIDAYRERYSEVGWLENMVYSDIDLLLKTLAGSQKKLLVATSKPTFFAEKILKHFGLDHYFKYIVGSNLDNTRTHKNEVIEHALSLIPETPLDKIVMVGDREHDIMGAHHCGIPCIAVGYGYGQYDILIKNGADAYVETVDALKHLLVEVGLK